MTEEQKLCLKAQSFKEDVKAHDINVINAVENKLDAYKVGRYDGFLAGLKAGRPQWHDLQKNPNDLPKEGTKVISEKGDFVLLQDKRWKEFSPNWDNIPLRKWEEPIAWCEIPTFDKE